MTQLTIRVVSLKQSSHNYRTIIGESFIEPKSAIQYFHRARRLQISWFGEVAVKPGQIWRLCLRLKQARAALNFVGFDAEKNYWQQGIQAKASVCQSQNAQLLEAAPTNKLTALREKLIRETAGYSYAAIMQAMLVGVRNLSISQWQVFQRTGTAHLVAISGLHIGILVSALLFCKKKLLAAVYPQAANKVPTALVAWTIATVGAWGYATLAGLAIPTIRAVLMLSTFTVCSWFRQKVTNTDNALFTASVMLMLNPAWLYGSSFWLSLGAVLVIFMLFDNRLLAPNTWQMLTRLHLGLSVAMAGLTSVFFQSISLISPVANGLAVPLTSFLIVPSLILASGFIWLPKLSAFFFQVSDSVLVWLDVYLNALSHFSWSAVSVFMPNTLACLCFMFGLLVMLLPAGIPGRFLVALPLLAILIPKPNKLPEQVALVTVLDVGQGLSVLIQSANHTLLYDTGGRSGDYDAGSHVLLPQLQALHITKLDAVVVSHHDNDHIGGLRALIKNNLVKTLYSSEEIKGQPTTFCDRSQSWQWDGVDFRFLYPSQALAAKRNNRSCVLQIEIDGQKILLPGDIEQSAEQTLLQQSGYELAANLLLAPHHGSKTSSTWPFIKAVSPEVVVYATGYQNRYHLPAKMIAKRYQALSAQAYDTAEQGAMQFRLDENGIQYVTSARERRAAVWRDP